jgi:hypothetical protein
MLNVLLEDNELQMVGPSFENKKTPLIREIWRE